LKYTWIRIGTAISTTWSARVVMLWDWKAKISTRVVSRASTVTGWNRATSRDANHSAPFRRTSVRRVSAPAARGMTTKTTTA